MTPTQNAALPALCCPVTAFALLAWAETTFPGLVVEFTDVPGGGARYSAGFPCLGGGLIQVDRHLCGPELTCALAEELGHHTTMMALDLQPGDAMRHLMVERNEERALRWAVRLLVPHDGIRAEDTVEDVADRWGVTEAFAERTLRELGGGS